MAGSTAAGSGLTVGAAVSTMAVSSCSGPAEAAGVSPPAGSAGGETAESGVDASAEAVARLSLLTVTQPPAMRPADRSRAPAAAPRAAAAK